MWRARPPRQNGKRKRLTVAPAIAAVEFLPAARKKGLIVRFSEAYMSGSPKVGRFQTGAGLTKPVFAKIQPLCANAQNCRSLRESRLTGKKPAL
jgi:hypothetical protein